MDEENRKEFRRYWVVALLLWSLVLYGFALAGGDVDELFAGLRRIIASPDTLITDYVLLGGPAPALVNAGLLGLGILGILAAQGALTHRAWPGGGVHRHRLRALRQEPLQRVAHPPGGVAAQPFPRGAPSGITSSSPSSAPPWPPW